MMYFFVSWKYDLFSLEYDKGLLVTDNKSVSAWIKIYLKEDISGDSLREDSTFIAFPTKTNLKA